MMWWVRQRCVFLKMQVLPMLGGSVAQVKILQSIVRCRIRLIISCTLKLRFVFSL
jgi:hypothetical protein